MVVFPLKSMPDPDVPGLTGWAWALLGQGEPLLVGRVDSGSRDISEVPKYRIFFFLKKHIPFSQDALESK